EVVSAVEATFRFRSDEPEISLGWRTLDAGRLFLFDHTARAVWLNAGYRRQLAGSTAGTVDDAPLLKAALYLLLEKHLSQSVLHQSTLEHIEAEQSVLAAAFAAKYDVDDFDPLETQEDVGAEEA